MVNRLVIFLSVVALSFSGCKQDDDLPGGGTGNPGNTELYFPGVGSADWETTRPSELGWDTTQIDELYSFLDDGDTRAFLVLKNGKIVLEHYAGKNISTIGDFNAGSTWYWASAGKTLTSFLVGQAQEDGFLSIADKTSTYLGDWTSVDKVKEDKITVRSQLTMTSGLDDSGNSDCTKKSCLTYKADAGSRWAYHNAPYTLLDSVIQEATQQSFDDYFNKKLRDPIGMDGEWVYLDYNHVFFSTARSMARFGLLVLNKGSWGDKAILGDKSYFEQMTRPSQDINVSYGYLWWLNGKTSYRAPGLQFNIPGAITPNAPSDMISGLGKNGQFLNVVPSQNLIVIRMGDNPDKALVPIKFQNDMWEKLNRVIR